MTFLDPWTAKSVVDIVNTLEQTSRKWDTTEDLKKAVTDLVKQGRSKMITADPTDDPDFIVRPIDWSKLASDSGATEFADMKQGDPHACVVNAVRFALQKRYNVLIGQDGEGDRVVWSLIGNGYVSRGQFPKELSSKEIHLTAAKEWLAALGIQTRDPVLVADIAAYVNQMRAQMSGMFLVAGDLGADHTFVLYEFRTIAGGLEAKVYNPWTGMNLTQPAAGSATDWYDVSDFQTTHGLPLLPNGQKIPNPGPSGGAFLHPLDPNLAAHAPLQYSVMFVPAL